MADKISTLEEKLVFCMSPTSDGKGPIITLGMSEACWSYMKDGSTHNLDLTSIGVPLRLILMRGESHDAIMKEIQDGAKKAGVTLVDERNRKDFGLKGGKI